jgi:alanine racemase
VDLTNIESGGVGSSVIFWGKGMPVDEVAESAGTISYELLCSLAQRIKIET